MMATCMRSDSSLTKRKISIVLEEVFSNAVLVEERFYRCKQGQELKNFAIAANVQGKIHIRFGFYVQTKAILYNKGACDCSNHTLSCK